jgi:hypothetical protein
MRIRSLLYFSLLATVPFAACDCGEDPVPGCLMDNECAANERCALADPASGTRGTCVANPECITDDECVAMDPRTRCETADSAFTCVFREGFADDCDTTRPCPFGQFCSTLIGKCYDAAASRDCTRRSQCPNDQICDREANKCVPDMGCYGDDFCENGEICDLVDHACRSVSIECVSCFLSPECSGDALCTVDTRECVSPGQMRTCRDGEQCDPLGRCVQCTNTDECGPGLFCNVALGRCESNVQCADDPNDCPESGDVTCIMCVFPEICEPRTRKCSAPATICESDINCPGDQYCDTLQDPPICAPRVPDCLNDLLDEPMRNDNAGTARLLEVASGPDYQELKMCPGELDWYKIEIEAGTYLTIDARFSHDDGDLDLQLYLEDGVTLVDESRSTNDNERVEIEAGTSLTVLLRVFYAVPQINPTDYRLIVARDSAELCPDDQNEPDDSPELAARLESDSAYFGRLCSADPDWYRLVNVAPATRIRITLDFTDNLGDLDLELYRAGDPTPLLSSRSLDDDEEIIYDASFGGDYFIRVVGSAADTNVYTIRAELRDNPESACLDDRFEPNNIPSTSAVADLILGLPQLDMTLCSGDEDWFALELGPGEAMSAEIGFISGADLELKLYEDNGSVDPREAPLRAGIGDSPREYLAFRSTFAGDYLLRVHGHTRDEISPYDLRIERYPQLTACTEDQFDVQGRGDNQALAVDLLLPPSRQDAVSVCSGDEDWYRVFLLGGFNNIIRLQYLGSDAQLDMAILDASGAQLVVTGGVADVKEIAANVLGQGIALAFVRVLSSNGGESPYSLTLDLIPVFSCFPDFAEPNETLDMVSLVATSSISPVELRDLTMCVSDRDPFTDTGDEDWFEITPPAIGARIDAAIDFQQGDMFMELLGPLGNRACLNFGNDRCYSDGVDLTESVTFTASVAGSYYLRVGSIYSSPAVPVRPPDADTPYNLTINYTGP